MTRRIAITNLSNWLNEDYEVSIPSMATITLAPGESADLPYPHYLSTDLDAIDVVVKPVINPEMPAKYSEATLDAKVTLTAGKWFKREVLSDE